MKNYLPIGSVVRLYGATASLMIIGIDVNNEDESGRVTNFDYISVRYPEGYLDKDSMFLFNTADIEHVGFLGCDNDERKKFLKNIAALESRQESTPPDHYDY